jgi:phosphatidylserine/phosphatidylglycerophosphate/cardiolipin synthase-like enzyme
MKLLVQPGEGVAPIIEGIDTAKKTIDIVIFRFDQREVERALVRAVGRGVRVHALIANTNRGGEKNLRGLELRLLGAGVTVARTADDLMRYHGKMIVIDGRTLYLLAFNFTYQDIDRSRSFAIITAERKLVREAVKLFEADTQRQPYAAGVSTFIVSPINAREKLGEFIKAAKKELLIYDPSLSDPQMLKLLDERIQAGVMVRVIGKSKRGAKVPLRKLAGMRLHTRSMVRDGAHVFVGSQSLRGAELDRRREIGIVIRDTRIAAILSKTFHEDWERPETRDASAGVREEATPTEKIAKKVAKAITKDLPPVAPVVEIVIEELAHEGVDMDLNSEKLEDSVKDAVKTAVKQVVREVFDAEPQEVSKGK